MVTPGRSLRARWTRRFAGLLVLLVVASVISAVGTHVVASGYRETARNLEQQAGLLARLQGGVVAHAAAALQGVGPEGLRELEAPVLQDFAGAADVLDGAERAAVELAREDWARAAQIARTADIPAQVVLATVTEVVPAVLEELDAVTSDSRRVNRAELARSEQVEQANVVLAVIMVVGALGLCALLVRRLSGEVLRPLEDLTTVAARLADGDLDARAAHTGTGEVGALGGTLNAMADAIRCSQAQLVADARRDGLTGLANRLAFDEALAAALAEPALTGRTLAVLFLDLDGFKGVNDRFGHAAGDALLVAVADRLRSLVRPEDVVARLGGDEFALLLTDLPDAHAARLLQQRATDVVRDPVSLRHGQVAVGVSAGLSLRSPDKDADAMLREADLAMYRVKGSGGRVPGPRAHV